MSYDISFPLYLWGLLSLPVFWTVAAFKYRYLPRPQFITLNIIRSLIIILLVLALSGLRVPLNQFKNLSLIFVVDRSDSIPAKGASWINDFISRIYGHLKASDEVSLVSFGGDTKVEFSRLPPKEAERKKGEPSKLISSFTSIYRGLKTGLSLASPSRISRIILFSDGNENIDRAEEAAQAALEAGVSITPVIMPENTASDILVETVSAPEKVKDGEAFDLKFNILNNSGQRVNGTVYYRRDGKEIRKASVSVKPGLNVFKRSQIIKETGIYQYEIEVEVPQDINKKNNRGQCIVKVEGTTKILVMEGRRDRSRYLKKVLNLKDINVVVRPPGKFPETPAKLEEYDALVLNNVPADKMGLKRQKMVRNYVENFGGGFAMIGGEDSFGSGGYTNSVIEEILPVTCEEGVSYKFKQVLLVILLDRSRSMQGHKLEMAKKAAVRVVSQLKDNDMIGVIAFDSQTQYAVPLELVYKRRNKIIQGIMSVKVTKRGTNIYPALKNAYKMLIKPSQKFENLPIQVKHIILLTDGKSYGGDFDGLVQRITAAKMTLSGIAIGYEADVSLLSHLSKFGKGMFHHPASADSLPNVFSVDLKNAITKAPFVERPFVPKMTGNSKIMTGITKESFPPLKGYMVTEAKKGADIPLVSRTRGFDDPILAYWRYGLGKVAAYTSDINPRWSSRWIKWKNFSKFWSQVLRLIIRRKPLPKYRMEIRRTPEGALLFAAIRGDQSPKGRLIASLDDPKMRHQQVELKRGDNREFKAPIHVKNYGKFLVRLSEKREGKETLIQSQGLVVSPYLLEYSKIRPNLSLLKKIAKISGGTFNPATTKKLVSYEKEEGKLKSAWQHLCIAALLLFLVEIGVRRLWI
ncbi:MAG: VWA domain-containing protein [bacterium]